MLYKSKIFLKYQFILNNKEMCVFIDVSAVGFQFFSQKFRTGLWYIFCGIKIFFSWYPVTKY